MAQDQDLEHWIALSLVPGLGDEGVRRLLLAFGDPEKIFSASPGALRSVVSEPVARAIAHGTDAKTVAAALEWLKDPANSVLTLADADYSKSLLNIPDPPPLLYVKGRRELLGAPALAIVGSRNATAQGVNNAEAFAQDLSDAGFTIISGLALGIDAAAHRGGLRGRAGSIAVLGTGLDIVYPAKNRDLAHELAKSGALVSEFSLGTPALGGNFPRRNRIISGLARGCLVVEAAAESGSLITARLALEQGREVFAIPGSIHSPLAKGCHALIKQGAKLVESAQDVLEEFGYGASGAARAFAGSIPDEGHPLLNHLGHDAADIDTLCARSGLSPEEVSSLLLRLELEGRVAGLPGGLYQRLR